MRIDKTKDQQETTVIFFQHKDLAPEIAAALRELNSLLGLQLGEKEISVTYGVIPKGDHEIALLTRSMPEFF